MNFDDVRRIAFTFPAVEEHQVFGAPTLRVGKRFLACIAKIDPDTLVLKILDQHERDYWLTTHPDIFYLTEHYQNFQCLLIRLSRVAQTDLHNLIEQSWRSLAPKRVIAAWSPPPNA